MTTANEPTAQGDQTNRSWKLHIGFLLIVVLVGAIWYLGGRLLPGHFSPGGTPSTTGNAGQVGDSFGVVNSLFSGLAFAGIIVAIFLQRQELIHQREELKLTRAELVLQREELKLTRAELQRSAEAQEASTEVLAAQRESMTISAYVSAAEGLRNFRGEPMREHNERLKDVADVLWTSVEALVVAAKGKQQDANSTE